MRALVLSALLLLPASASADNTSAKAETLFREGRHAAEGGDYALACAKFEESYALEAAPGTLLNLGDCEENRGQLSLARQHFRQLYDELPDSDDRKPLARERARAVEVKLRTMLLTTSAPETKEQPVARPYVFSSPPSSSGNVQRTVGLAVGATGVASLVTAGIFGGVALSNLSASNAACPNNVCTQQKAIDQYNRAQSFAIATDVMLGVGVALVGTAIALLVTAPREHRGGY